VEIYKSDINLVWEQDKEDQAKWAYKTSMFGANKVIFK
jgi:hypothetical protein